MAQTNAETSKKAWLIGGLIFLLAIAVVYFVWGFGSIFKFVLILLQLMLFLALLFALAYLFWYLFIKQHKFDVLYVNKMRMIATCEAQRRPEMKDLYISGDKGHSRVKIGKITGYLRTQVVIRKYFYDDVTDETTGITFKKQRTIANDRGEQTPVYELEVLEQDVFSVLPKGVLSMFSEKMCIRVSTDSHNELVGDIDLFGFSLIEKGGFHFLNNDVMEIRLTDYATRHEASLTLAYENMRDWKQVMDVAVGLDTKHSKGIQSKSLYELPEINQNQQQQK